MTPDLTVGNQSALEVFRARVLADESLQQALVRLSSAAELAARLAALASAQGIVIPADALNSSLRDDPLGLSRWTVQPVLGKDWPGPEWLPIEVQILDGGVYIDWAHFGGMRLAEPFYEESVRAALHIPFNRAFRYRMALADFMAAAVRQHTRSPAGFIFHMSRCGSTLAAQMLAAVPGNVVVSEARPLDTLVQLCRFSQGLPMAQAAEIVRALVLAFGRPRAGAEGHFFMKLDSWHIILMPFFRHAFPDVPWVFLYREPEEVLVSQMRQRGSQMVPELVSPALYGIDYDSEVPGEIYCAQVLEKICDAAATQYGEGRGMLVNYRDLPGALFTEILPHFGVSLEIQDRDRMASIGRFDAKDNNQVFAADGEAKRREVTAAVHEAAAQYLEDVYRRLEMLRAQAVAAD